MPRVDELVDAVCHIKCRYFSTLDMMKGYHQVKMDEQSKRKTAFICHWWLFQYQWMLKIPQQHSTDSVRCHRITDFNSSYSVIAAHVTVPYLDLIDLCLFTSTLYFKIVDISNDSALLQCLIAQ